MNIRKKTMNIKTISLRSQVVARVELKIYGKKFISGLQKKVFADIKKRGGGDTLT